MSAQIILLVVYLGLALAMDAFAVSITDGLVYKDINKKKALFIATTFGVMQAVMPLIGYWLVEAIETAVGNDKYGNIMALIVTWLAFSLLLFIGFKMLFEGIVELRKPKEEKKEKLFSYKEVLIMGVATAIDALASGVALHSNMSTNVTIWLHVSIILVITFILSLVGVILGRQIVKLFKGKYEITQIIGGCILLTLAVWVVLSHYLGI
ncbi:MAG: manganese efflux pump [Bacilli bacterium]|nr:manganese efflux pump [Bacilli bacterium]